MKEELSLVPVTLDDKYREKWNVCSTDFVQLHKNGVKLRDTLYRVGGFGSQPKDGYFMLLKHAEAMYEDRITKIKKDKPHLEYVWCIIDREGNEKVCFKPFDSPYLKGGRIYAIDSKYYDIETGELYCKAYASMSTSEFIFLENAYDEDKSKRGILKIRKSDGTRELFPA